MAKRAGSIALALVLVALAGNPVIAQQQSANASAPANQGENRPVTPTAPQLGDVLPVMPSAQCSITPPAAAIGTEEIVVTARRPEESLQRVPVAVTALGAAQLAAKWTVDSTDLATVTPSLYLSNGSFSSTNTNIALRGITSPGAIMTFDPSIGVYIDDVYLARSYGSLFNYFDISSVQVLRDVQGTLLGRNNTAGAILITRTKPQWRNDGNAEFGYGNYNAIQGSIVQNLIIVPHVPAIRAGFKSDTRNGYGLEVNSGKRLPEANFKTARASVLFAPTSNAELQLTYEDSHHSHPVPIFSPRAPTGRVVRPNFGFYDVAYDTPVYENGYDEILNGQARVDFGGVRAKLIVAISLARRSPTWMWTTPTIRLIPLQTST